MILDDRSDDVPMKEISPVATFSQFTGFSLESLRIHI